MIPAATFGPHEADTLRARIAAEPRLLVLVRSTVCPYGAAFHKAFYEHSPPPAVDLLVEEPDEAQWEAFRVRVSPTVLLFEAGAEAARLEGRLLLGLTRGAYRRWLRGLPSGRKP